jgi:hypothetical protein
MIAYDFSMALLNVKPYPRGEVIDEAAAKDVAQLISGSLIYRLYERLAALDYDMEAVIEQLELLCDTQNPYGLIYLVFILSDAANVELPEWFAEVTANPSLVPYLSSALIEDWIDFHGDYEN